MVLNGGVLCGCETVAEITQLRKNKHERQVLFFLSTILPLATRPAAERGVSITHQTQPTQISSCRHGGNQPHGPCCLKASSCTSSANSPAASRPAQASWCAQQPTRPCSSRPLWTTHPDIPLLAVQQQYAPQRDVKMFSVKARAKSGDLASLQWLLQQDPACTWKPSAYKAAA